MANKKILLKDDNGNILLPITQTDLVQHTYFTGSHDEIIDGHDTYTYHTVLLSSYLNTIHNDIDIVSSYIATAYQRADDAYTIASYSYDVSNAVSCRVDSILSSNVITGNQTDGVRLIQSLYFDDNDKLHANLVDMNAGLVKYNAPATGTTSNADNVQSAIDAINDKIDDIETMDLYSGLDAGNGVSVSQHTTEAGATISARVDNNTITFDENGRITAGNINASKIYTVEREYIPSQDTYVNVNKPIDETIDTLRTALGIEHDERISSDEELLARINALTGVSYISAININNDSQNVYPDSTGTAYVSIALEKLKMKLPTIPAGTSYDIIDGDDGDDIATMIAKLQAQVYENKDAIETSYDTLFAYIEGTTLTFELSEVKTQYDKNIIIF